MIAFIRVFRIVSASAMFGLAAHSFAIGRPVSGGMLVTSAVLLTFAVLLERDDQ